MDAHRESAISPENSGSAIPVLIENSQTFVPFSAKHSAAELCRISPDGSCSYNWPEIHRVSATWRPGSVDLIECLARLLSGLKEPIEV